MLVPSLRSMQPGRVSSGVWLELPWLIFELAFDLVRDRHWSLVLRLRTSVAYLPWHLKLRVINWKFTNMTILRKSSLR